MYTPPGIDPIFSIGVSSTLNGNITLKDIDLSQFYNLVSRGSSTFSFVMGSDCLGDEDIIQSVDVQNMNVSLKDNETRIYKQLIIFDYSPPSITKINVTVNNVIMDDCKGSPMPILIFGAHLTDNIYISNLYSK